MINGEQSAGNAAAVLFDFLNVQCQLAASTRHCENNSLESLKEQLSIFNSSCSSASFLNEITEIKSTSKCVACQKRRMHGKISNEYRIKNENENEKNKTSDMPIDCSAKNQHTNTRQTHRQCEKEMKTKRARQKNDSSN
jgi:hypothetical protein